jgi:hypothetical protein
VHLTIRVFVFGLGVLAFLAGILAIAEGGPEGAAAGIWPLVVGAGLMIVTVVERTRYRSEAAERAHHDPGPGGGEAGTVEPRFQATQELFRDPTSGRLMRVWVDYRTGERRYRAEG